MRREKVSSTVRRELTSIDSSVKEDVREPSNREETLEEYERSEGKDRSDGKPMTDRVGKISSRIYRSTSTNSMPSSPLLVLLLLDTSSRSLGTPFALRTPHHPGVS